ncbi:sugar O-acyltransferase (sialic acid O-acetyltransferase NeuD family) [Brevundimonas alba]|uniref:Sugar O-acyltransferase (Sialic acid O-acetyltransferase NeuD family) n=1 Tax=Brevundimonas alba TaxID=74314 RepID=A0A7X6BNC9_9CAUL|nr:acetyltransferase [Brevundimonas alba]NJC41287.1 sugar O-acyltransferase (sialic acid O-acetyltransferase NeuD family) [Brevundimonas alba]
MIHLIGGGGHCKVVIDALLAGGADRGGLRVRDGRPEMQGAEVLGVTVDCPEIDERLSGQAVHVAVGANAVRARLFLAAEAAGARPVAVRHPSASLSPLARIGDGAFVGALAVVGPGAVVGRNVIVNHGAVVEHDSRIGDHAFIGANAALGGGVTIGERATVGPGAVVPTGRTVGPGAVVAPGAVVSRDLQSDETWPDAKAPGGSCNA